jgi:membrane protease YdiL (CAAX protease family)
VSATGLWLRIGTLAACSVVLLLLVAPPAPAARLPILPAAGLGVLAGALLQLAVVRVPRRPALRRGSFSVLVAKQALFGILASNEEILWRRYVLGELLVGGAFAALAASTAAFALAHPARRAVHLGTGATFGALYLGTGVLAASIAAHWTYNVLVGARHVRADGPP